eukprot:547552_1
MIILYSLRSSISIIKWYINTRAIIRTIIRTIINWYITIKWCIRIIRIRRTININWCIRICSWNIRVRIISNSWWFNNIRSIKCMHKWYNNLFICRWYIKCSIEYIWSMNWFTIITSFIKWYNNIIRCIKRMYWWLMMIRLYKNAVLTFAFVGAELMDGCEDDTFLLQRPLQDAGLIDPCENYALPIDIINWALIIYTFNVTQMRIYQQHITV